MDKELRELEMRERWRSCLYHVEVCRKGSNLSEFRFGVYGISSSPHPYYSYPTMKEAQNKCDELNQLNQLQQLKDG